MAVAALSSAKPLMDGGESFLTQRRTNLRFTILERHPSVLLNAAFAFCLLFGLALIAQVQVAGDGMWHWYAVLWRHGRQLYGEMHFPLQPLFVLLTAAGQSVLGESWIASKALALLLLLTYCATLRSIVRRAPVGPGPQAVLLLTGFAFPLLFEAFRFDDYHVLADCFQILAVRELIGLCDRRSREATLPEAALQDTAAHTPAHTAAHTPAHTAAAQDTALPGTTAKNAGPAGNARQIWVGPILLGLCSGLSTMTRPNDGGVLLITTFMILLLIVRRQRVAALCRFLAAAVLTCAAVIGLMRDSIHAWLDSSVRKAVTAKGGRNVALYPFHLVRSVFQEFSIEIDYLLFTVFLVLVLCVVLYSTSSARTNRVFRFNSPPARAVILTLLFCLVLVGTKVPEFTLPTVLCSLVVLTGTVCAVAVLIRAVRALRGTHVLEWNAKELLLLIPVGQLYAGSLSSGGYFQPLSAPIGIFLVLLPFSFPQWFRRRNWSYGYAAVLSVASLACIAYKTSNPFQWHTYHTAPLFTARQVYHNPVMGPMVIERSLLEFIEPLCERVQREPGTSLLSLPFPYPNTFCGVAPWHDNVQSFFDISTPEMNRRIVRDLQIDPPRYIAYQRQIIFLTFHEIVYNSGKPLPQRAIDELIGDRLLSGQWSIASEACLGDADWILIQTVPTSTLPASARTPVVWDRSRCTRTLSLVQDPRNEPVQPR